MNAPSKPAPPPSGSFAQWSASRRERERLRALFPVLGRPGVYLDSAAKTLTPEPVLAAVRRYYDLSDANAGRGSYRASMRAAEMVEEARHHLASLIGAEDGEIVFTRNTTESIALVASGLSFAPGDRIVTTLAEHHSNFLPWVRLAHRQNLELITVPPDVSGRVDPQRLRQAVDSPLTRLVAIGHVSNALGTLQPVEEICAIARDAGALSLVDAAQSIPHLPIAVHKLGADFLAWSGHKMFAPTGTGALWGRKDNLHLLEPLLLGGGGGVHVSASHYRLDRDPPHAALEFGTQDLAGIAGFGAAACLLKDVFDSGLAAAEAVLVEHAADALSAIPGVRLLGTRTPTQRVGIASFLIDGLSPAAAAAILDEEYGIMVRAGVQCANPLMCDVLHLPGGVIRASFHAYSSEVDVSALTSAVRIVATQYGGCQ